MPTQKPCRKCCKPKWPMHMKDGVCRECQKDAADELAKVLARISDDTRTRCEKERLEYGGEQLSDRTLERLRDIKVCKTVEAAWALAKETVEASQVHFLAAWANGRIRGKVTQARLEKEIKEAEALAVFLDKKQQPDQAQQQRERAEKLRQELKSMRRAA